MLIGPAFSSMKNTRCFIPYTVPAESKLWIYVIWNCLNVLTKNLLYPKYVFATQNISMV